MVLSSKGEALWKVVIASKYARIFFWGGAVAWRYKVLTVWPFGKTQEGVRGSFLNTLDFSWWGYIYDQI